MPAQGASRTGKPGGKRRTASAGFADALLSIVPQGKGPGTEIGKAATARMISRPPRPAGADAGKDPGFPFPPIAPESKPAGDRGASLAAAPQEKRPVKEKPAEKEIRRKERSGKVSRAPSPPPAGTEFAPMAVPDRAASANGPPATSPSKKTTIVTGGSTAAQGPGSTGPVPPGFVSQVPVAQGPAAPGPMASGPVTPGVPAGGGAVGVIASGSGRAPSPAGTSVDPFPGRASSRARERSYASPQGVPEGSPRVDVPAGPRTKRPDGNPLIGRISPDRAPSLTEKEGVPSPLSAEADRPAVEIRTEAPRQKKPPVEVSRENAGAASVLPRSAQMESGRAESRSGDAVPGGIVPGPGSPRKPGSGKAGGDREEHPRKESEQAPAGTETAARTDGRTIPKAEASLRAGVPGQAADAPKRADLHAAKAADPGNAEPYAGLTAASPIDADSRIHRGIDASPTAPPPREPAPPAPLFQQVAMKMTPLPDGAHDVEIRLNPEHLGNLKIELHIDSGRMDASLRADTNEARALLLREEPALREALRNAGVTLSSFNVALSGEPWRERRGAARPDGDGDSPSRRGRKEVPVDGVASVTGREEGRDALGQTEHWIA